MTWSFSFLFFLVLIFCSACYNEARLQIGFYSETCPTAESIVASEVEKAAKQNPRISAILLRLHNHDCFVRGCDASVLVRFPDSDNLEFKSPNHAGLEGFEVIDSIKSRLEQDCPGTVSCADILALAARDAVALVNGPRYSVPTGRRDGLVSNKLDAAQLPEVTDSLEILKAKFADKGLSEKDLVLLSAAHTIGDTACFFVTGRLYGFINNKPESSDPLINPSFLPDLKSQCPKDGPNGKKIPLDHGSENKFDTQIFRNIRSGFAVVRTDAILYTSRSTREVIDSYLGSTTSASTFTEDFVASIVKMGTIGALTGSQGEIRNKCSMFN